MQGFVLAITVGSSSTHTSIGPCITHRHQQTRHAPCTGTLYSTKLTARARANALASACAQVQWSISCVHVLCAPRARKIIKTRLYYRARIGESHVPSTAKERDISCQREFSPCCCHPNRPSRIISPRHHRAD